MFSSSKYAPSGLTKKNCDVIAEYLNQERNPVSDCKFVKWQSSVVCEHDVFKLKMKSQTPVVYLKSVYAPRDRLSWEECDNIDKQIKKYFDTHFKDSYFYNDDQSVYYITDRATLAKLRDEALAFYQANKPGKSF